MSNSGSLHENLQREGQAVPAGSERSFGIVFAVVFLIVALWPLMGWRPPRTWALAISAVFLALAFLAPGILRPFNRIWLRFGELLHRIVSPIILAILFFLTVTPIAFIYRLLGKDPLRLKLDPAAESYWIVRAPPGPPGDSMKNQF